MTNDKLAAYKSEFSEDKWIDENLKGLLPEKGFYLDVGCAIPDEGSNTHFLRERGWIGLAIDAHPGYAHLWKNNFVCAVISTAPVVPFEFNSSKPGWSRVGKTPNCMLVGAQRLDAILKCLGVKKIDFISVDAEGSEFDIFNTFDVEQYKPAVIVSEYSTATEKDRLTTDAHDMRVLKMFMDRGNYVPVHQTVANIIYRRKDGMPA